MTFKKIQHLLLILFLFVLPWQTRYIWQEGVLANGHWEYGTFSVYGTEILLWVILLLFFIQNFFKKQIWVDLFIQPKGIKNILFLGGIIAISISVVCSDHFWVSYQYVIRLLEALAISIVYVQQDERKRYTYLLALWWGGVVQGILAIYQFLTQYVVGSKWLGMAVQEPQNGGTSVIEFGIERWLRAYGSFGSPNSLGIYLAVLFVAGLIVYLKVDSPRYKLLISAGQLFIVSGLAFSFSRSAWVAALLGVFSLLLIVCSKQKHSTSIYAKQLAFALVAVTFWILIFYPVFAARFNIHNRLEAQSISERQGQYAEGLSFIRSNLLFGVGPGAYTYALSKKYPDLFVWQYQPIHNIYMLSLVEMGVLAAGGVLLFGVFCVYMIIKNNILYLPVVITILATGLFDHWLMSMFTGLVFLWIILALGFQKKMKIKI